MLNSGAVTKAAACDSDAWREAPTACEPSRGGDQVALARSEYRLSSARSCTTAKAHGSACIAVGARTAARSRRRTVSSGTASGLYERTAWRFEIASNRVI